MSYVCRLIPLQQALLLQAAYWVVEDNTRLLHCLAWPTVHYQYEQTQALARPWLSYSELCKISCCYVGSVSRNLRAGQDKLGSCNA